MSDSQTILDMSSLPEQARAQLFDFYEFLSQKYNPVLAKEVPAGKVMEDQAIGEDDHRADFTDLFGVWSERDIREFCQAVKDFDEVNPEDWH